MNNALVKRVLDEVGILCAGTGFVLMGTGAAIVGFQGIRKNFYAAGVLMAVGAFAVHGGVQGTIGAIERIQGKK